MTTDRTTAVLSFVRSKLSLSRSLGDLLHDYRHAKPFPHLVLDDLFPAEELNALLAEMSAVSGEHLVHFRSEEQVKSNLRSAVYLGEGGFAFSSLLHSAAFLNFIAEITGISALLPDPYLSGAGYHVMGEGGKFHVHADANTDGICGLRRRLAMLTYLNKGWKSEFGGQLELWNHDATRCEKVIEPIFNRTVIFEVGDKNFHAVRPVSSHVGAKRRSFATYFHTIDRNFMFHNSIYAFIYGDTDPAMRRVVRGTLPPFIWSALRQLKKRHKIHGSS
jgi:2OG-Fe(II) oxygenase superfamily